jgi:hypothetical protein
MSVQTDVLTSWNAGAAREAVVEFVERTVSDDVPVEERMAVFDNDGTLWCEKPMPIQADFILRRLFEMAQTDPELRGRQPWKAAYERDYGWLGKVLAEHYAGDETNVRTLRQASLPRSRGSPWMISRRSQTPFYARCSIRPLVAPISNARIARWSNYSATGGERVLELHRLGRRSRLHAADQPRGIRHPT